ncbi:MAG: hypothetical protein JW745_01225 [Sedimentisphaerales bacterium]|nr:hypothetical protein [Sedimentisphaerales bacterium]MBN2843223.1 hypothetical protein [Sedimentisphaerales bacterium]
MKKKVNRAYISLFLLWLAISGCNSADKGPGLEFSNPYRPNVWTVAVIPFKNDSGSEDVSSIAMTDEFYTELATVQDNIQVLSVNQVMAAQNKLGLTRIKSEDELSMIAEEIGADALFVGKITRYQPYRPPLIGVVVQVYEQRVPTREQVSDQKDFDPSSLSRSGSNFELAGDGLMKAVVQVNNVFDASDKEVIAQIERYTTRQAKESPLGIDKVMTSSGYMRFVSHQVIGRLLYDYNIRTGRIRD